MKKLIYGILIVAMLLSFAACSNSEVIDSKEETEAPSTQAPTEVVAGSTYACTLVEITDDDYDVFKVADSVHNKLFNSTVWISEDRTKLVYTNEMGAYTANLVTEYDGEMWYESEVTWNEPPTPYGEHQLTATTLLFDEARGLVRMNFALDGKVGDEWSGLYFIFNEFELQ